jgi:glycosyltransferase involved in cell wall biosynthesis
LLNENDSLLELNHWIASVMQSNGFSYEVIFIDDGSTDDSWKTIKSLSGKDPNIKGLKFSKNFGKI